ncbi:hypothetical protein GSH10_22015 [Burkholderia pseudomallei]|nr:hypothetical protein [Burkholderia pseudomallei]
MILTRPIHRQIRSSHSIIFEMNSSSISYGTIPNIIDES